MQTTLYYFHDPMCSWCWAFHPVLEEIEQALSRKIAIRYVLGGLAADNDEPMPLSLQHTLQKTWHRIEEKVPGTRFNFDFWQRCQPRRSTYLSCRAVIAATWQNPDKEKPMIDAIQQAYYRQARNPSELEVLIELADEIGLNASQFAEDITSTSLNDELNRQIAFSRDHFVESFPTLLLEIDGEFHSIMIDYNQASPVIQQVNQLLKSIT